MNFIFEWDIDLCRSEEVCTKVEAENNRTFVNKLLRNPRIIIFDNTGHSRKWGVLRECWEGAIMRLVTVLLDRPMSTVSKVCTAIYDTQDALFRRFSKLRKATISFVMSVRLTARNNAAVTGRNFISECIFRNPAENIQVLLKSDKNNGHSEWRPRAIVIISCSVLFRMRSVWDKSCRGNQNTNFMFSDFFF
jgi:hypothetical protein